MSEDTSKWYRQEIKIPDGAQLLLEQYSGIAADKVVTHVRDLVRTNLNRRSRNHIAIPDSRS